MADNRKAPTLTVFDVMSNWLFAKPVNGSNKRPNLRIKVLGNVPRITVKTGVDGDKDYGKIDFQTDLATFTVAMHKLQEMAEGRDQSEGYIFDYENDFLAGKKLDNKIVLSMLQIGRDKESGKLYIAVISGDKSRPRIQFFFGPSQYHNIRRKDGSALTEREMSDAYAIGFLKPACKLMMQYLESNFDPEAKNVPKPMGQQGGGNGGGYGGGNRQGGNSGGYQGGGNSGGGSSSSFDEDLPEW